MRGWLLALMLLPLCGYGQCPAANMPVLLQHNGVYLQGGAGIIALCDGQQSTRFTLHNADNGRAAQAPDGAWLFANRESFVLYSAGLGEVWEISYNPSAPEIALGKIHDFQYREGAFAPGYLHPQRGKAEGFTGLNLQALPAAHGLLGRTDGQVLFYHLDVRRMIPPPPRAE